MSLQTFAVSYSDLASRKSRTKNANRHVCAVLAVCTCWRVSLVSLVLVVNACFILLHTSRTRRDGIQSKRLCCCLTKRACCHAPPPPPPSTPRPAANSTKKHQLKRHVVCTRLHSNTLHTRRDRDREYCANEQAKQVDATNLRVRSPPAAIPAPTAANNAGTLQSDRNPSRCCRNDALCNVLCIIVSDRNVFLTPKPVAGPAPSLAERTLLLLLWWVDAWKARAAVETDIGTRSVINDGPHGRRLRDSKLLGLAGRIPLDLVPSISTIARLMNTTEVFFSLSRRDISLYE